MMFASLRFVLFLALAVAVGSVIAFGAVLVAGIALFAVLEGARWSIGRCNFVKADKDAVVMNSFSNHMYRYLVSGLAEIILFIIVVPAIYLVFLKHYNVHIEDYFNAVVSVYGSLFPNFYEVVNYDLVDKIKYFNGDLARISHFEFILFFSSVYLTFKMPVEAMFLYAGKTHHLMTVDEYHSIVSNPKIIRSIYIMQSISLLYLVYVFYDFFTCGLCFDYVGISYSGTSKTIQGVSMEYILAQMFHFSGLPVLTLGAGYTGILLAAKKQFSGVKSAS